MTRAKAATATGTREAAMGKDGGGEGETRGRTASTTVKSSDSQSHSPPPSKGQNVFLRFLNGGLAVRCDEDGHWSEIFSFYFYLLNISKKFNNLHN